MQITIYVISLRVTISPFVKWGAEPVPFVWWSGQNSAGRRESAPQTYTLRFHKGPKDKTSTTSGFLPCPIRGRLIPIAAALGAVPSWVRDPAKGQTQTKREASFRRALVPAAGHTRQLLSQSRNVRPAHPASRRF